MTRKTFLTILILSITAVLSAAGSSYPSPYKISQITDNGGYPAINNEAQINNSGHVVYDGNDGIYLYDGTNTIQIAGNGVSPQINNNGYAVWLGNGGIFLYDGTNTTQIAVNGVSPQINNNGYTVWYGNGIYLYDGTNTRQITDSMNNERPRINDNGYVVWQGYDGTDYELYLYDGTNTIQLTDNSYDDLYPQINNNGYVVWQGLDGVDWEIYLYDGTSTRQITDDAYSDEYPQINDNGYVVWQGCNGMHSDRFREIYLYDGTRTIQITHNLYNNMFPQLNNKGHVVWEGLDGIDWETGYEIFVYDGISITRITNNSYNDHYPQLNDKGDIVWQAVTREIFIATPIIKLLSPNGSEIVPSGSAYTILWEAPKEAVKFDISYSLNNGATWKVIALNVTTLSYDWTVPKPLNNKKNCLVKVIGYDASGSQVSEDTSDSTFTIEVVKVTSPDGGENWKVGSTHAITWTTNGTKKPVANVKLFYTYNGGATWVFIRTLNGNPGTYNWRASANSANCKVKVVLKDALGKTIGSDVSDHLFTISP